MIINALLKIVLTKLVNFERHHTLSERVISVVKKIFLAQFINTAILLVLINANLNFFISSDDSSSTIGTEDTGQGLALFSGKYADFSVAWYNDVGVALMLTMVINIFAPHGSIFIKNFILQFRRFRDRHWSFDMSRTSLSTQRDLENLYRGPDFELATRYAQTLTTVFISFVVRSMYIVVWSPSHPC